MRHYLIWVGTGLALLIAIAVAIIYISSQDDIGKLKKSNNVWNYRMVQGSSEAPNKLIEYSDYFCEYCADFHEQVASDKFQEEYIRSGKVQLENRIVAVLAEQSPNTIRGAEAAYCAADQNKFREYTNDIIPRIRHDFFDKGVGVSQGVYKPIDEQPLSYFMKSADDVGLDEAVFESCMEGRVHVDEIKANTKRAIDNGIEGLPSISVNGHMTKGFKNGWKGFEKMLQAGGISID